MKQILNYINGELVSPVNGKFLDNINPATGDIYSSYPDSAEEDIQSAVDGAKKAFSKWSELTVETRAKYLWKIADKIEEQLDELAEAETRDTGKPIGLSKKVDIPRAAANFRFFAGAVLNFSSESHQTGKTVINYTLRQPLGVVGCISPWNLPIYLFTWKIAPALATGNCVIGKPSELTPMTAFLLSEICIDAGLPPGVLNIVYGRGDTAGSALVNHKDISAVSFTGGTETGKIIAQSAAGQFKKVSLEMGGKNPAIVYSDCNYEKAVSTLVRSAFLNQGQVCLCSSRILIESKLYDQFKTDFVRKADSLLVGDPLDMNTKMGAVISENHLNKILGYIDLAEKDGGTILCGGNPVKINGNCKNGWFMSPTVIDGLENKCRVNQEEIFGPVVTLIPFSNEEEAMSIANDSPYGLSATIWTQDIEKAHRTAEQLDTGTIWINCWLVRDLRTPFGGMKSSGMGREGGDEILRFFTEPKNICFTIG